MTRMTAALNLFGTLSARKNGNINASIQLVHSPFADQTTATLRIYAKMNFICPSRGLDSDTNMKKKYVNLSFISAR